MQNEPRLPERKSKRKTILFLILAIGMGFSPLLLTEFVLFVMAWEDTKEVSDPFIGLIGDQTLFELSADQTEYRIKNDRLGFFRPASFANPKPSNEYRVFVVGGSTVQGRPWENETAFPNWLEICLNANLPKRIAKVVNCGGVSYASYRISHIVEEVMEYEPDLLIVCTGHNEFLEDRTYSFEKNLSPSIVLIHSFLSNFRTYRFLRESALKMRETDRVTKDTLGSAVITRLDYEKGLAKFTTQSIDRDSVAEHFHFNITRMLSIAVDHEVPILLIAPPSNQKDCFPFKPNDAWTTESQSSFANQSLAQFQQMKSFESKADFHYFFGKALLDAGRFDDAKEEFDRAIDQDICPLRMNSTLRTILLEANTPPKRHWISVLDLQKEFEAVSKNNITGQEMLVDHVHPTIAAHQLIAQIITKHLQRSKWIQQSLSWEVDIVDEFENVIQSLDFGYFKRAKDRLESVKKWSRGQAIDPLKEPVNRNTESTQ